MRANTVSTRLRKAMDEQRLNCVQLATSSGVKTSFLYDILNGKSANPSAVQLAKVARSLNISLSYLAGTGKFYTQAHDASRHDSMYAPIAYVAFDRQSGKIISYIDKDPDFQLSTVWLKNTFGLMAADARLFRITSDDMVPLFLRNDTVLIDSSSTLPTPSGIFLIFDGSGLTMRRIEYSGNPKKKYVRILRENQHYSPDECMLDDILIVGRAIWISRCV